MQEHPVPQNITSYEFHLIGNMTLKQFFELGAGGILAFVAYSSNLPDLLKWPLVFLFVILGVAFAFVPLEERPLDHWFLAFIRAIYNPTKFYWKKTLRVPEVFTYVKGQQPKIIDETEAALPRKRERAQAYLQSISPDQAKPVEEIDQRAEGLLSLFAVTPVQGEVQVTPRQESVEKPSLEVSTHGLHAISSLPPEAAVAVVLADEAAQQYNTFTQPTYTPPVNIPQQEAVAVKSPQQTVVFESQSTSETPKEAQVYQDQPVTQQVSQETVPIKTNTALPFPKTPTTPNLVAGMVLDPDGKMIEQSIIEIRDKTGMPVRALRSNKLGQFFVSTPLPSGEYELAVEKDGYSFDTMKLVLGGKIIPPLEIRAKKA